jgi:hypothetical protein
MNTQEQGDGKQTDSVLIFCSWFIKTFIMLVKSKIMVAIR